MYFLFHDCISSRWAVLLMDVHRGRWWREIWDLCYRGARERDCLSVCFQWAHGHLCFNRHQSYSVVWWLLLRTTFYNRRESDCAVALEKGWICFFEWILIMTAIFGMFLVNNFTLKTKLTKDKAHLAKMNKMVHLYCIWWWDKLMEKSNDNTGELNLKWLKTLRDKQTCQTCVYCFFFKRWWLLELERQFSVIIYFLEYIKEKHKPI